MREPLKPGLAEILVTAEIDPIYYDGCDQSSASYNTFTIDLDKKYVMWQYEYTQSGICQRIYYIDQGELTQLFNYNRGTAWNPNVSISGTTLTVPTHTMYKSYGGSCRIVQLD